MQHNTSNKDQPESHASAFLTSPSCRVWCQGPKPEYTLQTQRFYIPSRCTALLRPKVDVIVLPGNHKPTADFFSFCQQVLGLDASQAVWTSGASYHLDDDVDAAIVNQLVAHVASVDRSCELVPYCPTSKFSRWAVAVKDSCPSEVSTFGETAAWMESFGSKGILHRHIRSQDVPSTIERIDPSIRVPRGYICSTQQDLLDAHDQMMLHEGCVGVVVKPLEGCTGQGIILRPSRESLEHYTFPFGEVALEEFLVMDRAPDGQDISPALHYMKDSLVGNKMVDQIMDGTKYSGWRTSSTSPEFQREAVAVMETVLAHASPCGPGGVDFLSVGGLPYLVDINTGRFNGAHAPKLFQTMYAPQSELYCWKCDPHESLSVFELWERLKARGVAFQPGESSSGVFPLLHLPGISGIYVALGDRPGQVEELYTQAKDCFACSA